MIHNVLSAIVETMNEFLRSELSLQEDMVVLTNPVDMKGNLNSQMDNKICVFLQHIEEERTVKNGSYQAYAGSNPPVYINLYVMFVANFPDPNYLESLRYISLVIEFFQGQYVFDNNSLTSLSTNVSKLSFEQVNFDFKDLSNVWGLVGLKYMPSITYKVKLLRFTGSFIKENVPAIKKSNGNKRGINEKVSNLLARGLEEEGIDLLDKIKRNKG
jgi:hypothetical protein